MFNTHSVPRKRERGRTRSEKLIVHVFSVIFSTVASVVPTRRGKKVLLSHKRALCSLSAPSVPSSIRVHYVSLEDGDAGKRKVERQSNVVPTVALIPISGRFLN